MCFRAVRTTLRLDVTSSDSKVFSYHILHMIKNVDAKKKPKYDATQQVELIW